MNKYQKIFLFSILIVSSIALFDIWAMNSGALGNPDDYLVGNFTEGWWQLFFKFNFSLIILISAAYYWFGKRDFSESISFRIKVNQGFLSRFNSDPAHDQALNREGLILSQISTNRI